MYGQNRSLLLVSLHAHWQPKIVRQTARLQMEYFAILVISVYEKLDGMLKGTQSSWPVARPVIRFFVRFSSSSGVHFPSVPLHTVERNYTRGVYTRGTGQHDEVHRADQ